MSSFTTYQTYQFPDWALNFFTYGEDDTLSDDDDKSIADFISTLPPGGEWEFDDTRYFSWYPCFGLPSTCVDAKYHFTNKETKK